MYNKNGKIEKVDLDKIDNNEYSSIIYLIFIIGIKIIFDYYNIYLPLIT